MSKESLIQSLAQTQFGQNGQRVDYLKFSSPSEVFQWVKFHSVGPILEDMARSQGERWCGLNGQSMGDFLSQQFGTNALRLFESSVASLQTQLAIGGRPIPAVNGGAWVVPLVLNNNPLPARSKPRARLPHKDLRFMLQVSAYVNQTELGAITAAIAKAAWDYITRGGSVSLTMFYVYGYTHTSARKTEALVCEVCIPLANHSEIATALSTVFYRPMLMGVASKITSPKLNDTIPMRREIQPINCVSLHGEKMIDQKPLAALGIEL